MSLRSLIEQVLPLLEQHMSKDELVSELALDPEALMLTLNQLPDLPDEDSLPIIVRQALDNSICTQSPRFMDKLYSGVRPIAAVAELIIAVLNTNVHVYHVSPYFTVVERMLIQKMGTMMGYDSSKCGGFFVQGGSFANLHAVVTARNNMFPEYVTAGVCSIPRYVGRSGPLQVVTSKQAHYSVRHACLSSGLMPQNIIEIECNSRGQIRVDLFEAYMKQVYTTGDARPYLLHITAGSTVFACFDNIVECSRICRKYDMWLHLDASYGGTAAFSTTHKNLLQGSSLCDSIAWNPHKLMGLPLICSTFLVKDGHKVQANSLRAGYLFHSDDRQQSASLPEGVDSWDIGDGAIGCGRRGDAFKLYLTWQYEGAVSFTRRIDSALQNARYMATQIKSRPCFKLVIEPEFTNVCFWWIPSDSSEDLGTATKRIHAHIRKQRKFMIDYSPMTLEGQVLPVFFRAVFNNPLMTTQIIDELLDCIDEAGSSAGGQMVQEVMQPSPDC